MKTALRRLSAREADTTAEGMLLAAEQRARVFDTVRGLAPDRREFVARVYGINRPAQSVRSVAEAWGVPKSRVDRMLARALAELRELLADEVVRMPAIVARRQDPCAACSLAIEPGEVSTYERTVGARHMACPDRDATRRRNLYAMTCELHERADARSRRAIRKGMAR